MKRRDFFKNAGLIAAGALVAPELAAKSVMAGPKEHAQGGLNDKFPPKQLKADVNRAINVVIIGIGNRGNVYASYAKKFPDVMKVAGIVDVDTDRLARNGKKYGVPETVCSAALTIFMRLRSSVTQRLSPPLTTCTMNRL